MRNDRHCTMHFTHAQRQTLRHALYAWNYELHRLYDLGRTDLDAQIEHIEALHALVCDNAPCRCQPEN